MLLLKILKLISFFLAVKVTVKLIAFPLAGVVAIKCMVRSIASSAEIFLSTVTVLLMLLFKVSNL